MTIDPDPARKSSDTSPEKPEAEIGGARPSRSEAPGFDAELDPDRGTAPVDRKPALDPEALAADRAAARTSDRTDARDGVDGSDMIVRDPDGIGGKAAGKPRNRNRRRA